MASASTSSSLIEPPRNGGAARLRFYNADGSEAGACGNATRCVARLLLDETGGDALVLEIGAWTAAGRPGSPTAAIRVAMAAPRFGWQDIPLAVPAIRSRCRSSASRCRGPVAVSMGNPHAVFFVDDVRALDVETLGAELERHPFFPERANIGFAQMHGPRVMRLRVFERGAGLTLACGSGACAAVVAAVRRGLGRATRCRVFVDGGELLIEWPGEGPVYMTGPTSLSFEGTLGAGDAGVSEAPSVITFGCRLNSYESEVIRRHAAVAGLGDAVIVHTCAVTAEAERQARQAIRRARRERPDARIIVTGCSAQVAGGAYAAMPEVDAVVGNAEKLRPETWAALAGTEAPRAWCRHHAGEGDGRAPGGRLRRPDARLPAGSERLRPSLHVLHHPLWSRAQPQRPGRRGHRPGAGADRGGLPRDRRHRRRHHLVWQGSAGPAKPRRALPAGPRCRARSAAAAAELDRSGGDRSRCCRRLIADEPRLMPHLHLSLQAGDDLVLKRMKRRHSRDDVLRLTARLRALRPDIVFGADIIAGFPTEDEAMFARTVEIVDEAGLTYLHVFPYSPRPQTPAARMPQVPVPVRQASGPPGCGRPASAHSSAICIARSGVASGCWSSGGVGRTEGFATMRLAAPADAGALLDVTPRSVSDGMLAAA